MSLRIGNAAGFWGDQVAAPRRLVESAELDVLTLEYLAELTMSILARLRQRDPRAGYAHDFVDVLDGLSAALRAQSQLKVITNAGGVNPASCARAVAKVLAANGLGEVSLAAVTGDDLLPQLADLQSQGCRLAHLDSGRPLADLPADPVSAHAYLGAAPIVSALQQGARIVITGRVADASLTVAPAVDAFGWAWDDWSRLAAGTVAGHLIECGAQVTGGYATRWRTLDIGDVGYPIAELSANGDSVITKPDGSGGAVTCHTVAEQLVYEIGDPARYLTPDVVADFRTVQLEQLGPDRVQVTRRETPEQPAGTPAPADYKVSLAYPAGFQAAGTLVVYGDDCVDKARACGDWVFERLARDGCCPANRLVELLGRGDAVPGGPQVDTRELVLRVSVWDPQRDVVERFARELAPLITSGPAGLAGYAAGRPSVRPVLAYWPTLVPQELVEPRVSVATADEWLANEGGGS